MRSSFKCFSHLFLIVSLKEDAGILVLCVYVVSVRADKQIISSETNAP